MDPKGKVALVTGGAGGMGKAFAEILLQHGANVVICDVNADLGNQSCQELSTKFGREKVLFTHMDIAKEEDFEDTFNKAKNHFKRLDIVVNNAGILADSQWERSIDVNLKGTTRGTLMALKFMGKDNGGRGGMIINIASVAALEYSAALPIYTAIKHGVLALSKCLGMPFHYARTGVAVTVLCPGPTMTNFGVDLPNKVMFPACLQALQEENRYCEPVTPDVVAKSFLHVLQNAQTGSVWVSEGSDTYEVVVPDRKSLRTSERW